MGQRRRLTSSNLSPFPDMGVPPPVCVLTTVCQTIVHANLLIYIPQTTVLTKSEWLFPVLSYLWEFKGNHTAGNSRVSNRTVAVVPWVEMVDSQADPESPSPTRLEMTDSSSVLEFSIIFQIEIILKSQVE